MSDGAVRYLPPLPGHDEGTRGTVTNHRMREVTEQVAQRVKIQAENQRTVSILIQHLMHSICPLPPPLPVGLDPFRSNV